MRTRVLHRWGTDTTAAVVNSISVFAARDSAAICKFILGYLQFDLASDREMVYPPTTHEVDQRQQLLNDPARGIRRDGSVVPARRRQDAADRRRPSPRWEACTLAR